MGKFSGGLRMAKASTEDIDAAMELASILHAISKNYYPTANNEETEATPTFFDEHDTDHLKHLYDLLAPVAEQGGLFRVVMGMDTILRNDILDPDDDCLKLHPKFASDAAQAARYRYLQENTFADVMRDCAPGKLDAVIDTAISAAEASAMPRAQGEAVDIDTIALRAAEEISLMWGLDRSQFVAKIQVRIIAAMRRAITTTRAKPAEPVAQVMQEIDFEPPPGYEIEEFLPNVWNYMFDDGEMSGSTSWRTHNLACLDAWKDYAASLEVDRG